MQQGYFGPGSGPVHLAGVYCDEGDAEAAPSLEQCRSFTRDTASCGHELDMGVQCTGRGVGRVGGTAKSRSRAVSRARCQPLRY